MHVDISFIYGDRPEIYRNGKFPAKLSWLTGYGGKLVGSINKFINLSIDKL